MSAMGIILSDLSLASKMTTMMDVVTMTIVIMMMKMMTMVITMMKMAITGKLTTICDLIKGLTNLNMASNFELVSCRARGAGGMVREAP